MLQSDEEIFITVIASAFLMISLALVVVIAIVKYQNRLRKHIKEVGDLKNLYQQEILKAQLEVQEQTFLSISQEIHDNIGQILSLIRLNISTIKPEGNHSTEQKIISSKELLDKAIEDLRGLSKRLNTNFLSQQSLSELLNFQLNLIQKTGLYTTTLVVHGEDKMIEPEKKLIIFRIVQEALNNIIKHAGAKCISVEVSSLPDKTIITIKDDGKGFEPSIVTTKGIGTQNMQYRAKLINAQFGIQSQPDEGTLIQLILPTTS